MPKRGFIKSEMRCSQTLNRSLSDSESPLNLGSGTARALSMVPAVANSFCRELSEGVGARDELAEEAATVLDLGAGSKEGIYSPSESEEGDLECLDGEYSDELEMESDRRDWCLRPLSGGGR
jgi:hypothetical protein